MRPDDGIDKPQGVWGAGEDSSEQQRGGSDESSPAPQSAPTDAGDVERDLDALLADAEAKKDEYLELARRTQADFENYRRRMAAEVQAASGRGKVELARELIDPVDNLERALEAAGVDAEASDPLGNGATSEVKDPAGLAHGVLLVYHGLRETLRRHGIESLNPKGERFDPTVHEALSTQSVEGTAPGTVIEVLQKGYRMNDHVIRPARVVVSA